MLDEKKIKESKKHIDEMLKRDEIVKEAKGKFINFFLTNSQNSFDSAQLLFNISTKEELKKIVGLPKFNGFLWVINASYYSMFYMARALLESYGLKIKTDYSLHAVVFDALVAYFYTTGKIEKQTIEELHEASVEVYETLGKEKAQSLIEDYFNEKEKRGRFTYEMGELAMQNKAQTSLERAKKFNEIIRKMIKKYDSF